MHHGYEPHCAYLLRLDAAGDPMPALPDRRADQLLRFCRYELLPARRGALATQGSHARRGL